MKVETPEQWAKRVAAEIRAGKLTPEPVKETVKNDIGEDAIRLAKKIGREAAARYGSIADKLAPYMIDKGNR